MADTDEVRRAYDELAETYAARRSEGGRGMEVLETFLEFLDNPSYILDAGCGQGTPVLRRLDDEAAAVGLDVSREQLRLAAASVPDAALVQGDLTALPVAADSVDGVVAYWSLIHVPLDDHRTVVDEFARILRPGGRVLVCEGTEEWVGENPDWLDSGVEMQWEIAGPEATREQLRAAGFEVVSTWGVPETLQDGESDAAGENEADENDADGNDAERGDANEGEDDREDDEPWTFFAARLVA